MKAISLPRDVATLVGAELEPGERIIWTGQPIPWRFARSYIALVLFGIPWTAFAVFWIAAASGFKLPDFSHGSGFFPLFGVPFVLVGLAILSTPYWMCRRAHRTAYVITDRRALILAGGAGNSTTVRSFKPDRLNEIRRVQNPDGSGDLIFERIWTSDGEGGRQFADDGFLAIQDVKTVEIIIQQLTNASKP